MRWMPYSTQAVPCLQEALHGTQGDHPLTMWRSSAALTSMESPYACLCLCAGFSLVPSYASQGCLGGMDTDGAAIVRASRPSC